MKKLGTSLIALGFAAAMFATASAEANDKVTSARQQESRVTVTAPSLPQASTQTEAQYDFGDADAYYNEHPEGGG
jgi:hypothetical protein